jgi:phosphatidylethanolamine/phosphatidyl-N-methylethanolamine N-methyltransferase
MDEARSYWERSAPRYGGFMLLFGGPMPELAQRVADEVEGAERVLELAAGTGLVSRAIAPVVGQLVATDYAEAMVEQLRAAVGELDNVETRQLDLYTLDGPEEYDAVVAANVLHLLPDLEGGLDRLVAVLKPGGRLLVPTYLHGHDARTRVVSWISGLTGFPGQRRFSLDTLAAALERDDLILRERRRIPGLLPIGFVSAEKVGEPTE